jgi:hypothetical protein
VHVVGAILCLLVAAVLTSVVVDDWSSSPGWVTGLALVATVVLVASSVRVYLDGARRKRETEGPRTKIVISEITPPPPRPRGERSSRSQ